MNDHSGLQFALPTGRLAKRIRQRKRPIQERSRATVSAILEATLQVLQSGGITALTTTRVAVRAGVSVGTLYQYFPDKQALLMALQVHYAEHVSGRIIAAVHESAKQPLERGLRALITTILAVKKEKLPFILAMRDAAAWPAMNASMRESMREVLAAVTALVRTALPHEKQPELKARIFLAAMEGALNVAVNESPALLTDRRFANEVYDLAFGYLGAT